MLSTALLLVLAASSEPETLTGEVHVGVAPGKPVVELAMGGAAVVTLVGDLVDELHLLLYPLAVGGGKRLFPDQAHLKFALKEVTPFPTGVVGLHYTRAAV